MTRPNIKTKIDKKRFVAIDFETANNNSNSACSIGLAIIEDLKIVETKHWLIRPPELYFHPFNISIHGITEDDVRNKPSFNELWPEIRGYIDNNLIIAHNASFDLGVLRHVLSTYNIDYPESHYSCTLRISKKVWKGLLSHSLESLTDYLSIEFQHHDAEEDARACAEIAIAGCIEKEASTLPELVEKINLVCKCIKPDDYSPIQDSHSYNGIRINDIKPEFDSVEEGHQSNKSKLIEKYRILNKGTPITKLVNKYFELLGDIQELKTEENFKKMLKYCQRSLQLLDPLINDTISQYGSFDIKSIPAIEIGVSFWAIIEDTDKLLIVKEIVDYFPELNPWKEIVKEAFVQKDTASEISKYIKNNKGFEQKNLKKVLSNNDGRMISYVCYYMALMGRLKREKKGNTYLLFV